MEELVKEAIANQVFPGCVIGLLTKGKKEIFAFGNYTYAENSKKVEADCIYDVASLTKTISTGFLILKLVDQGRINFEDKVQKYLPDFKYENVKIIHLLTYTINFRNFTEQEKFNFLKERSVEDFRQGIYDLPQDGEPGTVYKYSDATADLQGRIIENVCGENLNECFKKIVKKELNFVNSGLEPKDLAQEKIIPSQIVEGEEIVGIANDPKSRKSYKAGYFSGCAGLFSTASDVLNACSMLLNYGEFEGKKFLSKEIVEMMQKNNLNLESEFPTPLCTGDYSTADLRKLVGRDRKILGKSGFTGCQMLVDYDNDKALVILSNRTYPDGDRLSEPWHDFRKKLVFLIFH